MDIYRIVHNYKGTAYQSLRYYKSKEKAEKAALKYEDARAVLWLKLKNHEEVLMYCFELALKRGV